MKLSQLATKYHNRLRTEQLDCRDRSPYIQQDYIRNDDGTIDVTALHNGLRQWGGSWSDAAIGKRLGISQNTVHRHRTILGIPRAPKQTISPKTLFLMKQEWEEEPYVYNDKTMAERHQISVGTVKAYREKWAIKPTHKCVPTLAELGEDYRPLYFCDIVVKGESVYVECRHQSSDDCKQGELQANTSLLRLAGWIIYRNYPMCRSCLQFGNRGSPL